MSGTRTFVGTGSATSYRPVTAQGDKKLEAFLWKLLVMSALAYFVWSEQISIQIGPISIRKAAMQYGIDQPKTDLFSFTGLFSGHKSGLLVEDDTITNLTFALDPSYAKRHKVAVVDVQLRMRQCNLFIKRFSPVAVAEMRHLGVPASILMAQALLASNAGEDEISVETNNFFQRQCVANQCSAEHYDDFGDVESETAIDVFPNLWGSFRAQSLFFKNTAPYAGLILQGRKDYRLWARILSAEGYSNEDVYGEKLMAIIQAFKLDDLDKR